MLEDYGLAIFLIVAPLLGWLLWKWNELKYVAPLKEKCSSLNVEMPPGNLGFPFLGQTLLFRWYFSIVYRPDDFINSMKQKYGKNVGAYRTYLFGGPSIVACSPALAKFVLHSSDKFHQQWPTVDAFGDKSIISISGPRHSILKNFVTQATTRPDALARIGDQVQPCLNIALDSWSKKGRIKALKEIQKALLDFTGRYFANLEFGSQLEEVAKICKGINEGFRASPWNIPGTAYHNAIQCRKRFRNILAHELQRRKENKNEGVIDDLMNGLMNLKDENGNYLEDAEVIDNVLSSIQVSHIATGYLIAFGMFFLAKSPHVLQKLREENIAIRKEKLGIAYEDLSKLKYTKKVLEEIIRMTNNSGFIFKTATDDVEYKGYLIPKGWKVIVWLRYLHTDPENFEDPLCFNPDRWDTPPKHGTFFPFGGGVRVCPGQTFARVVTTIVLHHLCVGYKWELCNPNVRIKYLSHTQPIDGFDMYFNKM